MIPNKLMKIPLPLPDLILRPLPFVGLMVFAAVVALWLDGGLRPAAKFIPDKHSPIPSDLLDAGNQEQAQSGIQCVLSTRSLP